MTDTPLCASRIERYINDLDVHQRQELLESNTPNDSYTRFIKAVFPYDENDHRMQITADTSKPHTYDILITYVCDGAQEINRIFVVTINDDDTVRVVEYATHTTVRKTTPCPLCEQTLNDRYDTLIRAAKDIEHTLHQLNITAWKQYNDKGIDIDVHHLGPMFYIELAMTAGSTDIDDMWIVPVVSGDSVWSDTIDLTNAAITATYNVYDSTLTVNDTITGDQVKTHVPLSSVLTNAIERQGLSEHADVCVRL